MAYADDITIFIKTQKELGIIYDYFKTYETGAGAKLNQDKMEGAWIEEGDPPQIEVEPKDEIKILGILITNNDSRGKNWDKKRTRK